MDSNRPMPAPVVRCPKCATGSVPVAVCAACGGYNRPGHEGRDHRSFIPIVDPIGGGHLCGICAILAISEGSDFNVTLLLNAPAVEVGPMNATPRRPSDFPHDIAFHVLLDAFFSFLAPVTNANYGIGEPRPAREVADAALGALAAQHALLDRLAATRWCTVRDALVYGATVEQVAEAMALEAEEVAAGLRSWAGRQHEHGLMTDAQRDEVFALVDQAAP